jgi:hypothetical protein
VIGLTVNDWQASGCNVLEIVFTILLIRGKLVAKSSACPSHKYVVEFA